MAKKITFDKTLAKKNMYEYQITKTYFAQISAGMEELGAAELKKLGCENIRPEHRGIYFEADKEILYRINYQSRLVSRILAPLNKFFCHQTRYLYKKGKEIDWTNLFKNNQTFAIFANVSNSKITHSQYAAQVLKDAIVDLFREKTGKRPSVDKIKPDVWINLHIESDFATISWDTSGGSLHRRGYRTESVEAPMQETLAAAIIRLSGWEGSQPMYDPFCGSGTLLSEALMSYCRIPGNFLRKRFGFEFLPDFENTQWERVKKETLKQKRELEKGIISGSDISTDSINAAKKNLKNLPGGENVILSKQNFQDIDKLEDTIIVCNPPYGIRMGDKRRVGEKLKSFGDFLKHNCQGSTAYVYFGDRKLIPKIGLKPAWRKPLRNGGLDGRLAKFEIY
jgi:putative N6-adenine-specific DNA methylase